MTTAAATAAPPHPAQTGPSHFRRMLRPLAALFMQGLEPSRLAATLAVGTVCSLLPFIGATSLLNLVVGVALRMNQPALQTLNQLLGPVQFALILGYVRLGEWLWRAEPQGFTVTAMMESFRDLSPGQFLAQFGQAGVHAFSAWLITAPLLFALVYLFAMPFVRRCIRARPGTTAV